MQEFVIRPDPLDPRLTERVEGIDQSGQRIETRVIVERALFRYTMHTLPSEVAGSIGTSTLFAAWNAAIYVAQVEDDRLAEAVSHGRYLEATREVLQSHGGLWFYDESYVISRKRE